MRSITAITLTMLVGCTEYQYTNLDNNDSFIQDDQIVSADVLFVVDNSASMVEEQVALAANFADFADLIAETNADFQLGVVHTDMDSTTAGALTGDERLKREGRIDQATADVKEGLEKIVDTAKDLIGGSREEKDEQ